MGAISVEPVRSLLAFKESSCQSSLHQEAVASRGLLHINVSADVRGWSTSSVPKYIHNTHNCTKIPHYVDMERAGLSRQRRKPEASIAVGMSSTMD